MAEKKPGAKKPKPVVQITKVKKPMRKSVVRNPNAPKATGSGTTVKPITKSETFMKKGKAKGMNSGSAKNSAVPKGPKFPSSVPEKYKTPRRDALSWMDEQRFKKYGYQSDEGKAKTKKAMQSIQSGKKPSQKIAPKKSAPAPKKSTPKRRIFVGRGGRGGGIFGGGGRGGLNVNR